MTFYDGFDIESFEAGRGCGTPVSGVPTTARSSSTAAFPALEVGFAWPDPDAAIADAKHHIDRFSSPDQRRRREKRSLTEGQKGGSAMSYSRIRQSPATSTARDRNVRIARTPSRCCA